MHVFKQLSKYPGILVLLVISVFSPAWSATYFLAANGANSGIGPWATFSYAFSRMDGGDTLIVKNGTYTGNSMLNPPGGTA